MIGILNGGALKNHYKSSLISRFWGGNYQILNLVTVSCVVETWMIQLLFFFFVATLAELPEGYQ